MAETFHEDLIGHLSQIQGKIGRSASAAKRLVTEAQDLNRDAKTRLLRVAQSAHDDCVVCQAYRGNVKPDG